ncbi:MAG: energy-coupling factor ABC transporter permease [Synechococcales bacterium]|nr:energy-coupling factor ABC transporter permease [Synechococcales bacterium]
MLFWSAHLTSVLSPWTAIAALFPNSRFLTGWQPVIALHIPDGLLNLPVMTVTWAMTIGFLAIALKQVEREYQERTVPLMGVCAAFIFAAQMINFPIPGGSSGHLLGGTLAGALLGPWAGSLVMAVVFMVQGFIFQDGGITVMGANIVNMGLIGTFLGYYLFRTLRHWIGHHQLRGMVVATAIAAWTSVVVASIACAFQLALSGTAELTVSLIAMIGWHVMIGLGEALITVSTVTFIWRTRSDLFYRPPHRISIPQRVSHLRSHQ